ncbi:MAG: UvrB/UvrC motif-containing protein [Abitibacteriaceae bacterium]|nr:UvrB/UvrC motif-containing protein [Abditibacteriaceae bacterium]MBV9868832.1 UvrB/UvrC motif-containing protein [Abditibacteriaceae bacterium]
MWQRYAADTRRILLMAQEEAQRFNSPAINPEHLLLALLKHDAGTAHDFLRVGITPKRIQASIEALLAAVEQAKPDPSAEPPKLTAQSLFSLQVAALEARHVKSNHVKPEHLLLSLLRDTVDLGELDEGHLRQLYQEQPHEENNITSILRNLGVNVKKLMLNILYDRPTAEDTPQSSPTKDAVYNTTLRLQFILSLGALEAQQMGHEKVSVEHWLYVLLRERDDRWVKLFSECGLDVDHAFAQIAERLKKQFLQQAIADLNQAKEAAIDKDQYERAAWLRDRVQELEKGLQQMLDEWQQEKNEGEQTPTQPPPC